MKIGNGFGQKLRYGSASFGIVAAVLAVVLLLNIGLSVLCSAQRWYLDMTTEPLYTLTEEADNLLASTIASANANRAEDDPVTVDIIFCADPDRLYQHDLLRYVYYTALNMQKAYPDTIRVSTRDVWDNPSSVDEFRTNSYSSIYQSNVIVASGTEFRVYGYRNFFTYNTTTDETPWAYNGEKSLIKGIRAVTRAESPVCALTTNHGEPWLDPQKAAEYSSFLSVLDDAGYDVVYLDLLTQEIPENCRLIVTLDPQSDFLTPFDGAAVSELNKLDVFLSKAYSFMVFVDSNTPKLTNLEEYLEEWGVTLGRDADGNNFEVLDPEHKLDGTGLSLLGQYESEGMGGSLTKDMRETGGSPKVAFGNSIAIEYSPTYEITYNLPNEEEGTGAYISASYSKNNKSRSIYDVFRTGSAAFAYGMQADGTRVKDKEGKDKPVNADGSYSLMTITSHTRLIGEGQGYTTVYDNSYVCAIGSTDFAKNGVLSSKSYANTDVLLSTLRQIGKEIEPVGFNPHSFYKPEMDTELYNKDTTGVAITAVLTLLPAVIMLGSGIFVLVRRKVRT